MFIFELRMSLFHHIEEMQKRPEHERRIVHIALTTGLMSLVLGVWVLSRATLLQSPDTALANEATESPFSSILGNVRSAFSSVNEEVHIAIDGVVQLRDERF